MLSRNVRERSSRPVLHPRQRVTPDLPRCHQICGIGDICVWLHTLKFFAENLFHFGGGTIFAVGDDGYDNIPVRDNSCQSIAIHNGHGANIVSNRYSQAAHWRKLEAHAAPERKPLETHRLGRPARIPSFGNQSQQPPKALEIRGDK